MVVTLKLSEIRYDIANKSMLETAGIEDAEQRYRVQVGTDKTDEVTRRLQEAYHNLMRACREFLAQPASATANSDLMTTATSVSFDLNIGTRRQPNLLSGVLVNKMHEYMTDKVLELYYLSVDASDLASLHAPKAAEAFADITGILYYKARPTVSRT